MYQITTFGFVSLFIYFATVQNNITPRKYAIGIGEFIIMVLLYALVNKFLVEKVLVMIQKRYLEHRVKLFFGIFFCKLLDIMIVIAGLKLLTNYLKVQEVHLDTYVIIIFVGLISMFQGVKEVKRTLK